MLLEDDFALFLLLVHTSLQTVQRAAQLGLPQFSSFHVLHLYLATVTGKAIPNL